MNIHLMTSATMRRGGKRQQTDDWLWAELQRRGIAGQYFAPHDVSFVFSDNTLKLYVAGTELAPGALLVRSSRDAEERTYEIALAYAALGNRVVDPVESLLYPVGKLIPFIHRVAARVQPNSVFFASATDSLDFILSHLTFPFILKPQRGYAGRGVSLIHNEAAFNEYLTASSEQHFIAQTYIADIEAEFRVMVIGGKALGVVRKVSDQVVKNAAQGAHFEAVTEPDIMAFAERMVAFEAGSIYGTDIARTRDGALHLIENNRSPNFVAFKAATGIPVETLIIDFVEAQLAQ